MEISSTFIQFSAIALDMSVLRKKKGKKDTNKRFDKHDITATEWENRFFDA